MPHASNNLRGVSPPSPFHRTQDAVRARNPSLAGRNGPNARPVPAPGAARRERRLLAASYLMVSVSLLLPYLHPGLDNVRWIVLCIVLVPWLVTNIRWLERPALPAIVMAMVVANLVLRLLSIAWSPMPEYTAMRAVSLALLWLYLIGFASRVKASRLTSLGPLLILLFLAAVVLPGTLSWALGRSTIPFTGYRLWLVGRFSGMTGNPNALAIVLVVCAPIAIALCWQKKWKWWFVVVSACCLHSLILSGSRAGIVGAMIGITTLLAAYYKVRLFLPLGAFAVLLAWLTITYSRDAQETLYEFAARREVTDSAEPISLPALEEIGHSRFEQWEAGWPSIRRRPLLGQGYGIGGTGRSLPGEYEVGYPLHNSLLQVWQENGLVGLLLLLPLIGLLFWHVWRRFVSTATHRDDLIFAGVAGSCLGGLTSAFFESWLLSVGNLGTLPFWTCVFLFLSDSNERAR